jgi:DNA primase
MQNNLNQLIKQIEEKIKIEEVVSNYVNLERKGNNYVGLCPFHADSNPSMSVSPQKGIFKCFSCQAGGNAITFVQNHEGIPFIEAVKKLADKANID